VQARPAKSNTALLCVSLPVRRRKRSAHAPGLRASADFAVQASLRCPYGPGCDQTYRPAPVCAGSGACGAPPAGASPLSSAFLEGSRRRHLAVGVYICQSADVEDEPVILLAPRGCSGGSTGRPL